MPIGKQLQAARAVSAPGIAGSVNITAQYVTESKPKPQAFFVPTTAEQAETDAPPSYDESSKHNPTKVLSPTTEEDLEYFHAAATATKTNRRPTSKALVLSIYRTTQTQLLPVEERTALGPTFRQPFYAIRASASSKSTDEFNLLTLSRRNPANGNWTNACTSEIEPRIKLLSQGIVIISRIDGRGSGSGTGQSHGLTWDSEARRYTIWQNNDGAADRLIEITCDDWNSLDETPGKGTIVAESSSDDETLACISSSQAANQFICLSARGRQMLDLLVVSLLTVAIVETRKAKLLRASGVALNSQTTIIHTKVSAKIHVNV